MKRLVTTMAAALMAIGSSFGQAYDNLPDPIQDVNHVVDNTPDSIAQALMSRPAPGSTRKGNNPVLFLIGNSTMRNGTKGDGSNGQWGWGFCANKYYNGNKISVENQALGGMSTRTFYNQLWPAIRQALKPGDWVIVSIGHNDNGPFFSGRARAVIPGYKDSMMIGKIQETGKVDTVYSYGSYLRKYIAETRELFLSFEDLSLNRDESPIEKLGLRICFGKITNTLGAVLPNSPAHKAGLQVGDVIEQINGQKVDSWYRIQDSILSSNFAPLNLVVSRSGSKYSASVQPESKYNEHTKKSVPFVGIGPKGEKVDGLDRVVKYGFTDAVYKAVSDSVTMSKLVLVSAYKLINGSISADNISGPIAIAKGAQESASFGLAIFISFLAAISVNLGILNLLSTPVSDGGQLRFLAVEAIMRREPSAKTQAALTAVGAAVLLTLMIFAIFNDIKGL